MEYQKLDQEIESILVKKIRERKNRKPIIVEEGSPLFNMLKGSIKENTHYLLSGLEGCCSFDVFNLLGEEIHIKYNRSKKIK